MASLTDISYETFNYAEAVAWVVIGLALPWRFRAQWANGKWPLLTASLVFIVFGASDVVEAPTHGRFEWWLWAWKIACVCALLACRAWFLGRFRWNDRVHLTAVLCLVGVALAVWLQMKVAP